MESELSKTLQSLELTFDGVVFQHDDPPENLIDWDDRRGILEIAKLKFRGFVSGSDLVIALVLNPTFVSEVNDSLRTNGTYEIEINDLPLEIRGSIDISDELTNVIGELRLLLPRGEPRGHDDEDVVERKDICRLKMNGRSEWEFVLDPRFRKDLLTEIEEADNTENEYADIWVTIDVDEDTPWRLKKGYIAINGADGDWLIESNTLRIGADSLAWDLSFDEIDMEEG